MSAPTTRPGLAALRPGIVAVAAAAALLLSVPAARADVTSPDDLPDPTPDQLARSVHAWEVNNVHQWSIDGAVGELETVVNEGEKTTISLATDILFTPNSWELPGAADERIADLVDEIPDGAQVQVDGHTDSTPTGEDFDNQQLSTRRAQAVADVISGARADLDLQVEGLADSEPAEAEDPEDPATYAANRRVEIIYEQAG